MKWRFCLSALLMSLVVLCRPVSASVAVLAFELQDITANPATPEELQRTQSAQPLLIQALQQQHYPAIAVTSEKQQVADKGFGYLYDHPEEAAQLAREQGADYIVSGRIFKSSFLFVHFLVRLVDAKTGKVVIDTAAEAKGPSNQAATERVLASLARQLVQRLPAAQAQFDQNTVALNTTVYQKTTDKTFPTVVDDALTAISQNNFRILGQSEVGRAIAEREGIAFPATTVIQFCNLSYAKKFLEATAGAIAKQMPCRLIIREVGQQILLETVLVDSPEHPALAKEINDILRSIVDNAAS